MTSPLSIPALSCPITIVIALGAKEEVLWSQAQRAIAPMKYAHVFGNLTVCQFPRESVCKDVAAGFDPANRKVSVARSISTTSPVPASIWLDCYTGPESISQWNAPALNATSVTAKSGASKVYLCGERNELASALLTRTLFAGLPRDTGHCDQEYINGVNV